MKFEDERNRQLIEDRVTRIKVMEAGIERIRAQLIQAKDVLAKHETALSRKDAKGEEPGVTQGRVDKKRAAITLLETRLEELAALAEVKRQEINRILTFHPIQERLDHLPDGLVSAKKRNWKSVPNSLFKTFQDIFTPAEARILPECNKSLSKADYDMLPLFTCPVAPERIPDWFMEEFGFGHKKGLNDFEWLEVKNGAIHEISHLFQHAKPLKAYSTQSYRHLIIQEYSEEHDGKLIITAFEGRKPEQEDRKIMQVFDGIYEARRRTAYIEGGYPKEQEKLHGIRGRVESIRSELRGLRENDPKCNELRAKLNAEVEILGHVTNHYKKEVSEILLEVKDLRDSLDRHNPGAVCARLVGAINRISHRLPQIFGKSTYISEDKRILDAEIKKGEEVIAIYSRAYLHLCRSLEKHEDDKKVSQKLIQNPNLEDLTLRPFNLYASKLIEKADAIHEALLKGDAEKVRNQAIKAHIVCKTFQMQQECEAILHDIAESPVKTTIAGLLLRVRKLSEMAQAKEAFPGVRTGKNEAYDSMRINLNTAVKGLGIYSRRKMTDGERMAMYERFKHFLETIDFTKVLEKL